MTRPEPGLKVYQLSCLTCGTVWIHKAHNEHELLAHLKTSTCYAGQHDAPPTLAHHVNILRLPKEP